MSTESLLQRLARGHGIAAEYRDIQGEPHPLEEDTCRALLGAMGVDTSSDAAMEEELREREETRWTRRLPPVAVVPRSAPSLTLPITLPEEHAASRLTWRILLEDGRSREGGVAVGDLTEIQRGDVRGRTYVRRELRLEDRLPLGYHELDVRIEGEDRPLPRMRLILVPDRCYLPPSLAESARVWGPAVQIYALRSARAAGVGTYSDLRDLCGISALAGADVVGVSPLHALFLVDPQRASPYSPSSRLFLNPVHLDPEAVPEFAGSGIARRLREESGTRARLRELDREEQVRYGDVVGRLLPALEELYARFRSHELEPGTVRGRAFRAFQVDGGDALLAFGVFQALLEHLGGAAPGVRSWRTWPPEFGRPDSPAVREFAAGHRERIEFFQYLQWECDRQLGDAERRCRDAGMHVGLFLDLALSVDPDGFDSWWHQDVFTDGARIGAPPDAFNLAGQEWGLPPPLPEALRNSGYEPFAEALRASMRHAGALRVDHVMSLMRTFWIPRGERPSKGAYVAYDLEAMFGVLALESHRNRCLVVGEDLGTVPDEVRAAMHRFGVHSMRLLYFTREDDGSFSPPGNYPAEAAVSITSQDLPTLAGWWEGRDLALRAELGLYPEEGRHQEQLAERAQDRTQLLSALERTGLLPEGIESDSALRPPMSAELSRAIHAYLALTPARVLTVRLEDVLGELDQTNLPGTTREYPNWRKRLPLEIERLAEEPRFTAVASSLRRERGESRGTDGPENPRSGTGVPRATYRLQLHRNFDFRSAAELVPYLDRLGISHLYLSPVLEARPGSTHGYDVIDHGRFDPELGGEEGFEALVETVRRHGMGIVLDIVPNHMGIGSDNSWWMNVLEHGPASPYARFFDIDWHPEKEALRGKILLPFLEDQFGRVLERGLLRVAFLPEEGRFELRYHEHRFPLDPATWPRILAGPEAPPPPFAPEASPRLEMERLLGALAGLPPRDSPDPERGRARLREARFLADRLADLCAGEEGIRGWVEECVAGLHGEPGQARSFDRLEALLNAQAFRLAYWRVAADEINYRRFFDINGLAALRMEDPEAFAATHHLLVSLVREGKVSGLRIDHPDGLHDPEDYYRNLRLALGEGTESPPPPDSTWIVVEKILASHERLVATWPVHGTTGYEFMNEVTGLLVDPDSERPLDREYTRFIGGKVDPEELVVRNKALILETALASELTVLTNAIDRISEADRSTRDFTRRRLRGALREILACFPVYRTYVSGTEPPREEDRRYVDWAVSRARRASRAADTSVFDFLRDVLLLEDIADREEGVRRALRSFTGKFQQTSGAIMAKGLEDTTLYVYHRLLALNEVGNDLRRFALSPAAFHHANEERRESRPHTLLSTSTHDSKRSEDARARLAALSEVPGAWHAAVRRWAVLNRSRKRYVERRLAPSRNDEYAFYQTLLSIWPVGEVDEEGLAAVRERTQAYMQKAIREAKVHTSWINPDPDYEAAVEGFIEAVLERPDSTFLREFLPLARIVARRGMLGGLSQLLLKLTSPGVPDIYQGTETWTFRLVDPDNRQPVDYGHLRHLLDSCTDPLLEGTEASARFLEALLADMEDGRIKVFTLERVLHVRRKHPALFREGAYVPLVPEGDHAGNLCAFLRRSGSEEAVVVAPLRAGQLCDLDAGELPLGEAAWSGVGVTLPPGSGPSYRNAFTGERIVRASAEAPVPVAILLGRFPVGLWVKES